MMSSNQEEVETKGVRANNPVEFAVLLPGKRWYELLQLLEGTAVKGEDYTTVKRAVTLAELIREGLHGQGF